LSAFYVVAYGSLSIFGSVVAAIAIGVAFEAWRTRPARLPALRPVREPARS
jgi:hypothetical protein